VRIPQGVTGQLTLPGTSAVAVSRAPEIVKEVGIRKLAHYLWEALQRDAGQSIQRLKELEKQNSWLRRAVSNLTLDERIPQGASRGGLSVVPVFALSANASSWRGLQLRATFRSRIELLRQALLS